MRQMNGFKKLREQGRMTWIEQEHGWLAAPEEIMKALSTDGFEECKREMTTSRRDRRPADGVWQGVNTRTGCEASAIWVNHPAWPQAIVFIDIDGESLVGAHALSGYAMSVNWSTPTASQDLSVIRTWRMGGRANSRGLVCRCSVLLRTFSPTRM